MPCCAQLAGGPGDVAAHDRAGEDEQPGARQVRDGPHGGGDVLLADERDRVDADPLAAEVVAVCLAHRAEGDLGDLGAAADDDDPLAEDAVERAGQVGRPHVRRWHSSAVDQRRLVDAPRPRSRARRRPAPPVALAGASRRTVHIVRSRPPAEAMRSASAGRAAGASSRTTRTATVAWAGVGAASGSARRQAAGRWSRPRRTSSTEMPPGSTAPSLSCSSNVTPSASNASRVAAGRWSGASARRPCPRRSPTIPPMLTERSPSAVARRASAPGRSSSRTVNQTHAATSCLRDGTRPGGRSAIGSWQPAIAPTSREHDRRWRARPSRPTTVQVFGREDSQATRAALRFFKERRVTVHFVDLRRKPIAAGELRRFVERLGAPALADTAGTAWRDGGSRLPVDGRGRARGAPARRPAPAPAAARARRQPVLGRARPGGVGWAARRLSENVSGPPSLPPTRDEPGRHEDAADQRPARVVDHEAAAAQERPGPGRSRRGRPQRARKAPASRHDARVTSGWHPSPVSDETPRRRSGRRTRPAPEGPPGHAAGEADRGRALPRAARRGRTSSTRTRGGSSGSSPSSSTASTPSPRSVLP